MFATQDIQKDAQAKGLTPLLSFIVTAYNIPGKMLRECIASILALSLSAENREIIVVDDGSDETALKSLKEFVDEIIYIRQRNQGLSAARNTGLRISTGRYVQFVDGDDFLLQTPYEHCLDMIRYHQPVDMVLFSLTSKPDMPLSTDSVGPLSGTEYMLNNNIHGSACGYIFSKSILGNLKFTTGIYHEDEEFTPLLLLRAKRMYITKAGGYFYRKRHGSIIHSRSKEHEDKRLEDFLAIIVRLRGKLSSIKDDNGKKALDRRIAQLSMDYLYLIIKLKKSYKNLKLAEAALEEQGLYPLPDRDYTLKYKFFRKLI